jgi:hypothetical protein
MFIHDISKVRLYVIRVVPVISSNSYYADPISFLRQPVVQQHIPDMTIRKKIAKHLRTSFGGSIKSWLDILPQIMPHWAKVRIGNGGDLIRGAIVQKGSQQGFRDASFVHVGDCMFVCMTQSTNTLLCL